MIALFTPLQLKNHDFCAQSSRRSVIDVNDFIFGKRNCFRNAIDFFCGKRGLEGM